jgi:hypothetical protein
VNYQRERWHDFHQEAAPLFAQHWQETPDTMGMVLDPDLESYNRLEEMGMLRCFTARSAGQLAAYDIFMVVHHRHARSSLVALSDVLFVLPAFRTGRTVKRLIEYCNGQLSSEGVQVAYYQVNKAHDFSNLLESMGHQTVGLMCAIKLERPCPS